MAADPQFQDLIIHRHQMTSDETSPWDGIAFVQPVGSDSLADQLKRFYPAGNNLRERKHLAAIDFLKKELKMIKKSTSHVPMDNDNVGSPSGASHASQDITSGSSQHSVSTHGSPIVLPISSPKFTERDHRHEAKKVNARSPTQSFPNSAMQTFVFDSSDGRPMQLKTRRTMTPQERERYKQTRKRGACTQCKKTKAKCTHVGQSQTDAVGLTSPKKPSKRLASTPGPDENETKKVPKIDYEMPVDIQIPTIPAPGLRPNQVLSPSPSSNDASASDSENSESSDTPTPANTSETRLTTPVAGL